MYEPRPAGVWRHLGQQLFDLLLPMPCLACDGLADYGLSGLGLCARCRGRISKPHRPLCHLCGLPLSIAAPPSGFICLSCRTAPPAFDRLVALWSYQPPIDEVLRAFKFSRLAALSQPLGRMLADHLRETGSPFDLVSYVPLHWYRRLVRGFDQAEALAAAVARRLGMRVTRTLVRQRATRAQSRLPRRERSANLDSAFGFRRQVPVFGKRLLLVDDVATSGATLANAASCLKRAGAASVTAAVVARTPRPGGRLGEVTVQRRST